MQTTSTQTIQVLTQLRATFAGRADEIEQMISGLNEEQSQYGQGRASGFRSAARLIEAELRRQGRTPTGVTQ